MSADSLLGALGSRIGLHALAGVRGGAVVLRQPDGRGRRLGDGQGPEIVVDLRRPGELWRRLARRPRLGVGESYVDGDWDCDDLPALFALLGRNLDRARDAPAVRAVDRLERLRPVRDQRQDAATARGNVHAHYDLGNDLFLLMLDPTMTYSCAYWERPGLTLQEAQEAKLQLVVDKLGIGPVDHVLEIGCGWGGFAIHAARTTGCRVTGVTLSSAQAELARVRVREAGLERRVEILERDYRLVEGSFSRIVSIEMLEAIGAAEHDTYFRSLDRLLAPGGRALVQAIGMPDHRYERYRRTTDWIQQYVFPGSLLPSLEAVARSVARTRLLIAGVEEIGIGYARTLRHWRENVEANVAEIRRLGFDERFLRTWRFYLASCEAAFAIRALRDMQIVLTRSYDEALPEHPTRRFAY